MNKRKHRLAHPLDGIFSAPSHVAVLRALRDSREGMSGRAVARRAEVNHQACALALRRLEALGLVRRQGSGKTQLVLLNDAHVLVREILLPSFSKERELVSRVRREISGALAEKALALTLFGSAARGEAMLGSDIDLLLLCPCRRKEPLQDAARDFAAQFLRRYGVRLSPLVLTLREARDRHAGGDPLIRNILRDGLDLGRRPFKEFLE